MSIRSEEVLKDDTVLTSITTLLFSAIKSACAICIGNFPEEIQTWPIITTRWHLQRRGCRLLWSCLYRSPRGEKVGICPSFRPMAQRAE